MFVYNRLGYLTHAYDQNHNLSIQRCVDPFGNVLSESFPNGFTLEKTYDLQSRLTSLTLPDGYIEYAYDPLYLRAVTRYSKEQAYTHRYTSYDLSGNLLLETLPGNLGDLTHAYNSNSLEICRKSPYFSEYYQYDSAGNLIDRIGDENIQYTYDALSQLTSESNRFTYAYDSLYNRTHKNDQASPTNTFNELSSETYDLNGHQISLDNFTLSYDLLGRLLSAHSEEKQIYFTYDPLGRRLSKKVIETDSCQEEHYLYHGTQEIGAFDSTHHCKNLRLLANEQTLAIELPGKTLIPLCDNQGSIRRLIDLKHHTLTDTYDFSAFGEELAPSHSENPWRYASKRFDPDLHLLDFGARFYDMRTGRWLTPDPEGFRDSTNLYQYVFNNPFKYTDPDGKLIFAVPLLALTWKLLAVACITACVGYQIEQMHSHHSSAVNEFNAAVHQVVQGSTGLIGLLIRNPSISKNIEVYAPDRPLPRDKDGVPIPEVDKPHT